MPQKIKPHWFINGMFTLLAFFVLGFTVYFAWLSYEFYRNAQAVNAISRMADRLNTAASAYAIERGLTATVLGAKTILTAEIRKRIIAQRQRGDGAWNDALAIARTLQTNDPHFLKILETARRNHRELEKMRHRVDRGIIGAGPAVTLRDWFTVPSRVIEADQRLWEAAFRSVDMPKEVTWLNLSLRKLIWQTSEYAGRERGMLAFFVSARKPLTWQTWEQVKAFRGMVERNIGELNNYRDSALLDAEIIRALEVMREKYFRRFESTRAVVYAKAQKGDYPFNGLVWMERASIAIDSIVAVSRAITRVTENRIGRLNRTAILRLGVSLAILIVTFGLVLLSLTRVRKMVNDLFRQKELVEVTMDSIGDAVVTTDAAGRVEYLNPIAEELTGWANEKACGQPLKEVFNIINSYTREPAMNPVERCLKENSIVGLGNDVVLIRRDGREFSIADSAAPIRDREGRTVGAVMVFYDTSDMRREAHLLSYHATHDILTGLVNRREFERQLGELMRDAKSQNQQHALCYLDLDQFKVVNDTCGHGAGDKMLRQLAVLLKQRVRSVDTLARLGGDEFVLLLPRCSLEEAVSVAEDLCRVTKKFRFSWEGTTFDVGVSIGVVPITSDSHTPAELLSEADSACYAAKEKGRNRIQVYQAGDLELARRHGEMQWVSRINRALEEDRFCLYCQPIQSLTGEGIRHHEILVRLLDETGELVPPGAFIPAAERYNLMGDIDRWVIRRAFAIMSEYLGNIGGSDHMVCNINLSGSSLGKEGLSDFIHGQLKKNGLLPKTVCFEITETAAVSNLEVAIDFINTLKELGCSFALDDFGTGLSSFAYLKNLAVDYLKIDGNFIRDMADDPAAYAMVQAINTVGHALGIQTVAECVETPAIVEKIKVLDIDYAQGFGVARPHPIEDCLLTATNA